MNRRFSLEKKQVAWPTDAEVEAAIRSVPIHMALSTLSGCALTASARWTAEKALTGTDYNPVTHQGNLNKTQSLGTAAANTASGGADELASFITSISGGGNATIDCTSFTNILQVAASTLARIKGFMIRLLSTTDDATNGTNASSVAVGNASANQQNLILSTNATMTIKNGGCVLYLDPNATGIAVSAGAKNIFITNNDGSVTAKVQVTLIGGST